MTPDEAFRRAVARLERKIQDRMCDLSMSDDREDGVRKRELVKVLELFKPLRAKRLRPNP